MAPPYSRVVFILLIVSIACLMLVQGAPTTCSFENPLSPVSTLTSGSTFVRITGAGLRFYALKADNTSYEAEYMEAKVTALKEIELNATHELCHGSAVRIPSSIGGLFDLSATEDCSCTHGTGVTMLSSSVKKEFVTVTFSCPKQPDLDLSLDVFTVNGTFYQYYDDVNYDVYFPDTVKFSVIGQNWKWQNVPQSYLSLFADVTAVSPQMDITSISSLENFTTIIDGSNVKLTTVLQRGFLADGAYYRNRLSDTSFILEGLLDSFTLSSALPVCNQNRFISQARNFSYDPTFSALFSAPVGPGAVPSKSRTLTIALAASFSIVGAIILAVLLILGVKSNTFKNWVRPYRARKEGGNKSSDNSTETKQGWTRSSRPTM